MGRYAAMKSTFLCFCFCLIGTSLFAQATVEKKSTLDVTSFLEQVKAQHNGIQASRQTMESTSLKGDEGSLAFAPNVFATISHTADQSPITNQAVGSNKMTTDVYTVGVKENFRFGTNATLSYNLNKVEYEDPKPTVMPQKKFYTARPMIELRQPLWRNSLGKEFLATETAAKAKNVGTFYAESYKIKSILMDAEMAYWKLSFARQAVKIQTENLNRATKLKEWTSTRVDRQLADKADLIQVNAMISLRVLELRAAKDDERVAAKNVNVLRGINSDTVSEVLIEYAPGLADALKVPGKKDERDDVRALKAQAEATSASSIMAEEKNKPTLEVFGNYALNGKDTTDKDIPEESTKANKPTWSVGVTVSTPLDLETVRSSTAGYRLESQAAAKNYERKVFEQEQEWQNLNKKLEEAKSRLKLASAIEDVQKVKLEYERERHLRGRSTLYQVLLFEQDYASSQLNELTKLAEVLQILSQMKTFSE